MAGTKEGGIKAAATNISKHGADFYARIGSRGGTNSRTGGFASSKVGKDGLTGPERAKLAGHKGGKISRRGPAIRLDDEDIEQVKKEIAEAKEESIKEKIRLLNKELDRLRNARAKVDA